MGDVRERLRELVPSQQLDESPLEVRLAAGVQQECRERAEGPATTLSVDGE
jgi:hypothetical protein